MKIVLIIGVGLVGLMVVDVFFVVDVVVIVVDVMLLVGCKFLMVGKSGLNLIKVLGDFVVVYGVVDGKLL